MQLRYLGWAGVEVEHDGHTLLIDYIEDDAGMFLKQGAIRPSKPGATDVAVVTHLHEDHADPAALKKVLAPGAPVFRPETTTGPDQARTTTASSERTFAEASLSTRIAPTWSEHRAGPFRLIAAPAVDGLGDAQRTWIIEAGDERIVHAGDTMNHGHWWSIAAAAGSVDVAFLPVNGPVLELPHLRPASPIAAAMLPEEAAAAAHILGAALAVPIHYGDIAMPHRYVQADHPASRFAARTHDLGLPSFLPAPGEWFPAKRS